MTVKIKPTKPNVEGILKDPIFKPSLVKRLEEVKHMRQDASAFIRDVMDGTYGSAIVYGRPGTGKTTLVQSALESAGLEYRKNYWVARSHITPAMLYVALYNTRRSGQFLVLDDCDTILNNELGINMIKAATDQTYREVRWDSTHNLKSPIQQQNIPPSFEYQGTIIITTNITPHSGRGRMAQHMDAVRSRCVPFSLTSDDNQDAFAHLFHLVYDDDMLAGDFPEATWDHKVELLKFVLANIDDIRMLDLRKPAQVMATMLKHPRDWQRKALRILRTA